jgi:hypothetical protein
MSTAAAWIDDRKRFEEGNGRGYIPQYPKKLRDREEGDRK